MVALFRADTRVGAGGVYKGEHGHAEFFGKVHQAQGFAVAFGAGHAKVAVQFFFGVAPFLMPNHHHAVSVKTGNAADNGVVVGIMAIAVQFLKIGAQRVDVVLGVWALRMARDLRDLRGGELGENGFG